MIRPATLSGVIKGAGIVGLVTILVRFLSFGREIVAAALFGAGEELDIFLIAYLVPAFLFYSILACAGAAIIPVLIKAAQDGETHLRDAIARANGAGLIGFCGLGLLAALLSPLYLPWIGSHLDPEKITQAQHWLLLLCWLVPLYGFAALWAAIANAQGKLAIPAIIPALSPLATIAMLFAFADEQRAGALVMGMLAGAVLEFAAIGMVLYRARLLVAPRIQITARGNFEHSFATLFAGAAILGLIPVMDQAMAASIGSGAISSILFGGRLVALSGSVGALALGAAVLPAFAALAAASDYEGLRKLAHRCVWLTLGVAIPVCAFISWFSIPIVDLMFQRQQFNPQDTQLVSSVQAHYILQIPFYLAWIVLARVLAAMKHNGLLLALSAAAAALNAALNYFFIPHAGVAGIAGATSIVFFLLFLTTLGAMRYYLPPRTSAPVV